VSSPALWRNREYVCYRTARVTSTLGSFLSGIAYPLLVLHLDGSAAQAGAVTTGWLISNAVCQLPGGHLADRFDRRLLMISMDIVRLAVVATIPVAVVLGHLTFGQLLAVALVEGAATAVFGPATTALVRSLVPAEQLPRALAQGQGLTATITLIGPALGGLFFSLTPMLPFALDAASYGLSALLLCAVPAGKRGPGGKRQAAAGDGGVTAGMRWLRSHPEIIRIIAFTGVLNLAGAATQVSAVIVMREHGTHAGVVGIVMACIGVGGIVGALLAGRLREQLAPARLCLAIGTVWAGGFLVLAAWSATWTIGPVLAILFFLSPAAGVMLATITLGKAPEHLLGRVSTAEQILNTGPAALSPLLAGLALQAFGAPWLWLTLSVGCALATMIAIRPLLASTSAAPAAVSDQPTTLLRQR